eukprot:89121-Rhodomonas_salina.3
MLIADGKVGLRMMEQGCPLQVHDPPIAIVLQKRPYHSSDTGTAWITARCPGTPAVGIWHRIGASAAYQVCSGPTSFRFAPTWKPEYTNGRSGGPPPLHYFRMLRESY